MTKLLKSLPALAFATAAFVAGPALADDHKDKDKDKDKSGYETQEDKNDGAGTQPGSGSNPSTDPYDPSAPSDGTMQ